MDQLTKNLNNLENRIIKHIYDKYILNKNDISINTFKNNIYDKKRSLYIINNREELIEDIKNINIATLEYNKNPDKYNQNNFISLPDSQRCNYIRETKHRYYRCKNKQHNYNHMCHLHYNMNNIYLDNYNKIILNLTKDLSL